MKKQWKTIYIHAENGVCYLFKRQSELNESHQVTFQALISAQQNFITIHIAPWTFMYINI